MGWGTDGFGETRHCVASMDGMRGSFKPCLGRSAGSGLTALYVEVVSGWLAGRPAGRRACHWKSRKEVDSECQARDILIDE